jgi:SAM-dependent methyltransferase
MTGWEMREMNEALDGVAATSNPMRRADYQSKRLKFLSALVNLPASEGLEIGACDLPTVPANIGGCSFADIRSSEEMIQMWNLPPSTVVPIKFLLDRTTPLYLQIAQRFDYVVACHVLEHVANPIGYVKELALLLKPSGGIICLAVPDKRFTFDVLRSSTTLEHLLSDYHDDCRHPSIEHILEFSIHGSAEWASLCEASLIEFYQWACAEHRSGKADAHCHVWRDEEFFVQVERLINGGVLPEISIAAKQATPVGYNEFMVALRRLP